MTARTYIKKNIPTPYRKKLLNGLDIYLRRIKSVHFHEYKVAHLAQELSKLQQRKGIGKSSIQELKQQLKSDGYL